MLFGGGGRAQKPRATVTRRQKTKQNKQKQIDKGMDSPLRAPSRNEACHSFDFSPVKSISDFSPSEW